MESRNLSVDIWICVLQVNLHTRYKGLKACKNYGYRTGFYIMPPCMATPKWEMVPAWHRHVRTCLMWGYTTRFFQSKSQFILNKTVNVIQWTEVFPGLFSLGKYMLCLPLTLCDVCYRVMPATQSQWVAAAHDQDQPLSPERESVINAESLAVGTGRQSCFHRQNLRVLRDFHPLEDSREKVTWSTAFLTWACHAHHGKVRPHSWHAGRWWQRGIQFEL